MKRDTEPGYPANIVELPRVVPGGHLIRSALRHVQYLGTSHLGCKDGKLTTPWDWELRPLPIGDHLKTVRQNKDAKRVSGWVQELGAYAFGQYDWDEYRYILVDKETMLQTRRGSQRLPDPCFVRFGFRTVSRRHNPKNGVPLLEVCTSFALRVHLTDDEDFVGFRFLTTPSPVQIVLLDQNNRHVPSKVSNSSFERADRIAPHLKLPLV
jgi:hypothetical protein